MLFIPGTVAAICHAEFIHHLNGLRQAHLANADSDSFEFFN